MFEALLGQVTAKSFVDTAVIADANQGAGRVFHLMHGGVVKQFPQLPAVASMG
jgi:hypothetical protein